jgi:hypothetical protein
MIHRIILLLLLFLVGFTSLKAQSYDADTKKRIEEKSQDLIEEYSLLLRWYKLLIIKILYFCKINRN